MGPALLNAFGQVEAIHRAWHIDIREEHPHIMRAGLQNSESHVRIGRFQDVEARLLEIVCCGHSHDEFILDEQNDGWII